MTTRAAIVTAAVLTLTAACKQDPGPWHVSEVTAQGQISVDRKSTGTYVDLVGVAWPPPQLPTAKAAADEVKRLAGTGEITVTWSAPDAWYGPGSMRVGTTDVAEALITAGLARAAGNAPQALRDAEAKARKAAAGGWGVDGRAQILRWLRGQALALHVLGGDIEASPGWRASAWQIAASTETTNLAFFEVVPGADPGPPPCVDRLASAIQGKLHAPATVDDVKRAFAGTTLVDVPSTGAARCQVWKVKPGADVTLVRSEGPTTWTRHATVAPDAAAILWGASVAEMSDGDTAGTTGESGGGRASVSAAGDDALLIGGSPWFTTAAACQRELAAAFPSGCSEP